jgi:hypothetical protein
MVSRILKGSMIVALFVGLQSGSVAYAQSVSKTVAAGGVLKLGHYASVNPDCSPLGMPVVRLSAAPTHGVVRTVKTSAFSHFTGAPSISATPGEYRACRSSIDRKEALPGRTRLASTSFMQVDASELSPSP